MFVPVVISPGPKLSEAYITTETGMFKGVTINEMGKLQPTNCRHFFQSCQ